VGGRIVGFWTGEMGCTVPARRSYRDGTGKRCALDVCFATIGEQDMGQATPGFSLLSAHPPLAFQETLAASCSMRAMHNRQFNG
jgi:hypothetical protein